MPCQPFLPVRHMISAIDQCLNGYLGEALMTFGLLSDALGAFLLVSILFVGKDEALERTQPRIGPSLPVYRALLRDSKRGKLGAGLLIFGFVVRISGVWL